MGLPESSRSDLPEFDVAILGYDRRQVEQYVADVTGRLETALRGLEANAVLQQQLTEAHLELDQVRATRPATADEDAHWTERIGQIMAAAEEQAAALRADAERDAEQIRARAMAESLQARRDLEAALQARQESARRLEELFPADPVEAVETLERRSGDLARS